MGNKRKGKICKRIFLTEEETEILDIASKRERLNQQPLQLATYGKILDEIIKRGDIV